MPDERLVSIARRLQALTAEGKLRWQPVREDAAAFAARLGTGSATIRAADPQGRYPYRLELHDVHGAGVGALETGQDAERWLGDREADPWEVAVRDLYAAARGSAVKPDAALDAILDELENR